MHVTATVPFQGDTLSIPQASVTTTDVATVTNLRPGIAERRIREHLEEVRRLITVLLSSDEPIDDAHLDTLFRRLTTADTWARWAQR